MLTKERAKELATIEHLIAEGHRPDKFLRGALRAWRKDADPDEAARIDAILDRKEKDDAKE